METKRNFATPKGSIAKAAFLAFIAGLVTACNDNTANNPNSTAASPTPVPTQTVVVSPSPVPTTTVVISPTPIPTRTVVVTPTATPTATVVITEPITDVAVINRTTDRQLLANKRVQFTNVTAQNVNGDRTFWIGTGGTQPLFVVLTPPLDAGSAENKVVVKPGQTLNLTGVLKPMPSPQQAQTEWGLSPAEAQQLSSQTLYLQAERIQSQQR